MKATAARPLLVVAAVLASGVAESQSATMMAPAPLESALCLAGNPAHVFANSSIDATGAKWVLNFGSPRMKNEPNQKLRRTHMS